MTPMQPGGYAEQEMSRVRKQLAAQTGVHPDLRERATLALTYRLILWQHDALPGPGRFKNKVPVARLNPVSVRSDPVELVIIRAIAMTSMPGAAQFGVSPSGAVFTSDALGWSMTSGRRMDVTGFSALLDEAADLANAHRRGRGGRFYERGGKFFMADGRTTFLEVEEVEPDGAVEQCRRYTQAIQKWSKDRGRMPTPPAWVKPEKPRLSVFLETTGAGWCPVHHIVLPASGRCDDCE